MRNFITSASPLALTAYAKAEEGTGAPGITEETNEKAVEPEAPTSEEEADPWAGFEVSTEVIGHTENKYGFDKYPAPKALLGEDGKPNGKFQFAAKRVDLVGMKADAVRNALKKHQDREVSQGKPKPEFRTTTIKDAKDVAIAVLVQRIK